ncbi:MAG: hypothetical protein M3320_07600 [Actinomycetota bacterium]|nr:hypothetical protein [Actinomycetota bacterium]MDQ5808523.1 hypothetical protein [Actinomycetota bacterium]
MFDHLSPDEVRAVLEALEDFRGLKITLEREVDDGRTEIFRGTLEALDEDGATIAREADGRDEEVPVLGIVRIAIER